jgi:mevalonate kinase
MKGQACGKVILFGEHAVVYGIPAIAVGINHGTQAWVEKKEQFPSQFTIMGSDQTVTDQQDSLISQAFHRILEAVAIDFPVQARVQTELPPAAGLGCSATMAVALVDALVQLKQEHPSRQEIAQMAGAWEDVFHGTASGIDACVAAHGGAIWFQRGATPVPMHLRTSLHLAIGESGVASSTKRMVESLARLRERKPEMVKNSFEAIESLVRNARVALESSDLNTLGKLLDLNQMLLAGLFLSSKEIETLCGLARDAGALGAKLTGAGGGGCVVALCEDNPQPVLDAWQAAGFSGFSTVVASNAATRIARERSAS